MGQNLCLIPKRYNWCILHQIITCMIKYLLIIVFAVLIFSCSKDCKYDQAELDKEFQENMDNDNLSEDEKNLLFEQYYKKSMDSC